jgi:hypothetical protein
MKKIAIITIHNGNNKQLYNTCVSINNQLSQPEKHLIISKKVIFNRNFFLNRFSEIILCKDKSLYNAMNLALKKTESYFVLFINSGDLLYSSNTILKIRNKINASLDKCYQFYTVLKYKNFYFFPKKKFFFSKIYLSHPSFVRPYIKYKNNIFYYNEKIGFMSDVLWMKKNIDYFRLNKNYIPISIHNLGGISTSPNLKSIKMYLRQSFYLFIKEFLKMLIFLIFNKEQYYKIIYKKKFYLNETV